MQTKFNIGDKVKILDGSDIDGYIGGWTPHMNRLIEDGAFLLFAATLAGLL